MELSRKATRRLLYVALFVTLPVPFYLGALEVSPALRMFFLTSLTLAVVATEGGAGYLGSLALIAAGQSLLWALLIWGLAAVVALGLGRVARGRLHLALTAGLVLLLLGLGTLEIYRTPLSSDGPYSNLAGLFD